MASERETVLEIAVSTVTVGLFIAVIIGIGSTFNDGGLSQQGALALIGSIAGFVLLMVVVALVLSRK
ncbi:DUF7472 family protein [Halomarina litorea]|uniref:DUF7472 family protein n=1 Tax=Halomarina litorea TaxID=2961595 RepID=UPI0020C485C2|nr:hypothetical protein [Halomarina sp. BCD28]